MSPQGNTMTAAPPLPPEIQAQSQPSPVSMFSQMGASIPDPLALLEAQIAKLEAWAAETAPIASQVDPGLATLLVPIAQAGKAMQAETQNLRQRTAGPSPQVMGSAPPNVPGNIPGARPAM